MNDSLKTFSIAPVFHKCESPSLVMLPLKVVLRLRTLVITHACRHSAESEGFLTPTGLGV